MKTLHLLFCTALALLHVAGASRINYHSKRHRAENQEELEGMMSGDESGAEVATVSELPYCFSWEPCQFVMTKKNPKDNMPVRKTIPSWCRCDASQKCALVEYDRRKKMDVYKCQEAEQPISISVRHLRSRGGGDEWIFSLPLSQNNRRTSAGSNEDTVRNVESW